MIFFEFSGGLGNQLFQLVQFENIIEKKKIYPIFIDGNQPHEKFRLSSVLENFPLLNKKLSNRIFRKLCKKAFFVHSHSLDWWDNRDAFQLICSGNSISYIYGLFQFAPTQFEIDRIKSNLRFEIDKQEYSCMHVRLGDYLRPSNRNIIGVQNPIYYRKALEELRRHELPIYVITDGNANDVHEILNDSSITVVRKNDDIEEFQFLCQASHLSITNSTFSLWASYLSNAENIYAPNEWFPAQKNSTNRTAQLYRNNFRIL